MLGSRGFKKLSDFARELAWEIRRSALAQFLRDQKKWAVREFGNLTKRTLVIDLRNLPRGDEDSYTFENAELLTAEESGNKRAILFKAGSFFTQRWPDGTELTFRRDCKNLFVPTLIVSCKRDAYERVEVLYPGYDCWDGYGTQIRFRIRYMTESTAQCINLLRDPF